MTEVQLSTHKPWIGDPSPWGQIQDVQSFPGGLLFVSTASHGGFFVPKDKLSKISGEGRRFASSWSHGWGDQWYEEDCAAAYVVASFPESFRPEQVEFALGWIQSQKGGR